MKTWNGALALSLYLALTVFVTTAESAPASEPLPTGEIDKDFRGQIVYKGTYSGAVIKTLRKGQETKNVEGAFTLTVIFDGAAIKAKAEMTGVLRFDALSGVVSNGKCKLYAREALQGPCDFGKLSADTAFSQGNQAGTFHFEGTAVSVENYVIRDAQRAAQAEESRKKAEAARAEELVARAKMRAALPAGAVAKYKPILNRAVTADAAHWFSNRYADGSIDLVGVHNDAASGAIFLKAYFQYAGGREGWVAAAIKGGQVLCVQFWDESSGCRGVGDGANAKNAQLAAGFLAGMMSSGSGSSPASQQGPQYCITSSGHMGEENNGCQRNP